MTLNCRCAITSPESRDCVFINYVVYALFVNILVVMSLNNSSRHLFLSRFDYCNALLAGLPASSTAPLQRCQNAAARLVLNLKSSDHITPALIELHWLPIKYRIIYKLCLLVHKSLSLTAPSYLSELFIPISSIPSRTSLRSASSTDLLIQATRLQFGDRAFAVAGSHQWNLLSSEIRTISDIGNFKRKLKTHLFVQAFGSQLTVI